MLFFPVFLYLYIIAIIISLFSYSNSLIISHTDSISYPCWAPGLHLLFCPCSVAEREADEGDAVFWNLR